MHTTGIISVTDRRTDRQTDSWWRFLYYVCNLTVAINIVESVQNVLPLHFDSTKVQLKNIINYEYLTWAAFKWEVEHSGE